jgi:molecular chaperone DnaK
MHNEQYRFKVDKKEDTASQLSSFILKKLVQDASVNIGEIKDVVISVPAYFKEKERNATIEAGKIANLNVIAIINEPTAAALYYATTDNIKGKVIIYDLGGGTFDITLAEINGKDIDIIASVGDHHLGGIDFDKEILGILETKYKSEKNTNLCSNTNDKEDFLLLSENIKKQLSIKTAVKQNLKGDGGSCMIEISREEFEEKISNYIAQTELLAEHLLHETNVKPKDIDHILLVGGSTRIPAFAQSIKAIFGKEPLNKVNVDEAVALGAAIKAGIVTAKDFPQKMTANMLRELKSTKLTDVANHSYGTIISAYDEKLDKYILENTIIIKKNTPLPCSVTNMFYTIDNNQEAIDISITQGEDNDPDFVDYVGERTMKLPPNRPRGQEIEVIYEYDENQTMKCTFRDVASGKIEEIYLDLKGKNQNSLNVNDFLVD